MRVLVPTLILAATLVGLSCSGTTETSAGGSSSTSSTSAGGATTSSTTSAGGSSTTSSTSTGGSGGSPACTPSGPACDDGDPCTTDACSGEATCTHAAVPAGTPCGDEPAFCTAAGQCVAQGNKLWSAYHGRVSGIAVTADGDLVVATTDFPSGKPPQVNVARLHGATGGVVWEHGYTTGFAAFVSGAVALDPAGDAHVTGVFQGSVDFGGGPIQSGAGVDGYLVTLDPEGAHLESRRIGNAIIKGAAADASGDLALAGAFRGSLDLGGGPVTAKDESYDIFAAKLDPAGQPVFVKGVGGAADACSYLNIACDQGVSSMALDASGAVVLAGGFRGQIDLGAGPLVSAGGADMFLARLDPSGQALWSRRFGDAGELYAPPVVAAHPSGDVVLAGIDKGLADFGGGPLDGSGAAFFLARFDASGQHLWSKLFGAAPLGLEVSAVAMDAAGAIVVSGVFAGTLDLGGGPMESPLYEDAGFVAKLSPSGELVWAQSGFGGGALAFDGNGNLVVGSKNGVALLGL